MERKRAKEPLYIAIMIGILKRDEDAKRTIAEIRSTQPPASPENTAKSFTALATIENTYSSFETLLPPKKYVSVHQKFLKAAKFDRDSVHAFWKGVKDEEFFHEANELRRQSNKLYEEAIAEFKKLG